MGQELKNTTHGSDGKFVGSRGLTAKQTKFVAAYIANGGNANGAAMAAGYAVAESEGWRLSQNPAVQAAIHKARQTKLSNLATAGLGYIEDLLNGKEEANPRIKLDAAKFVINLAGHVAPKAGDVVEEDAKPLEEMSIQELEDFVRRGEQAARQARQPIIDNEASPTPQLVRQAETRTSTV